jgi:hypothetical protein
MLHVFILDFLSFNPHGNCHCLVSEKVDDLLVFVGLTEDTIVNNN